MAGFDGDDNFFELGGDSPAALKIVNQFTDTGLSFSLSDFYDHPTLNEQLALLSSAVPAEAAGSLPPAGERRLPLTPIQPVLVLDSLRRPDSTAYWMISAHRFTAPVSVAEAQHAWEAMVAKNPALRTRILRDSSGLSQVIDVDSSGAELRCVESLSLAGTSLADWSAEKTSLLLDRGMDTLVAGWFIASCDERAGAEPAPVLVFAAHHALLDGWSLAQCLEDFVEALADPPSQPVVPRLSVAAYFDWRDQNGAEEASFEYWRRRLAGRRPAQTLDFARTATDEADAAVVDARAHVSELSASDSAAVAAYGTGHGVTQAAFLAHVWGRVLARYQEDADICVGLTANIRPATLPGSTRLSGCLINVVPLVCPETGGEVVEGARLTMNAIAAATEHGHVTHPRICEAAGLPPSTRLFASTLVFQNFDGDLGTLGAGAPVARLVHSSGGTSDPLSLTLSLGSVLQPGSWTADVFLGDLLKALCTGGRLVVCPDERRVDMTHLEALIREHRITLMESTPALVSALLRHIDRSAKRGRLSLRTLIVGSDIFRSAELEQMRRLLPPAVRLVNGYGLSECTVESVIYDSARSSGESRSGLCPIGEPLPGTELDIVNGAGHRLPRGALGEVLDDDLGSILARVESGELSESEAAARLSGIPGGLL